MITRRAFSALLSGSAAGSLLAQEATFGVDVHVVDVYATVRDKDGRIVSDLNKDDFILEENGKRQEIKYFARRTDVPLTLGLLVDTSASQRRLIETQRYASVQFLRQVLRPEHDRAFLIKFDREVELLEDLTGSRETLERALALLNVPGQGRRAAQRPRRFHFQGLPPMWPGGGGWPGGRRPRGGQAPPGRSRMVGTAMYDAIYLAADEVLHQQQGRKAIILITDGVDAGSKMSKEHAIEFAQRADAIVYSIRYFDSKAYPRGRQPDRDGEKALTSIAEETGGRMMEVSDKLPIERVFELIQEELRNQYSIGYTPADSGGAGFRKIELRTVNRKLKVQARPGYYPKQA